MQNTMVHSYKWDKFIATHFQFHKITTSILSQFQHARKQSYVPNPFSEKRNSQLSLLQTKVPEYTEMAREVGGFLLARELILFSGARVVLATWLASGRVELSTICLGRSSGPLSFWTFCEA